MYSILLWMLPLFADDIVDHTAPQHPENQEVMPAVPEVRTMPMTVLLPLTLSGQPIESGAGASQPVDAFDVVSSPSAIKESNESESQVGASAEKPAATFVVFDAPATIAVPAYDRFGGRLDQAGANIYEGMAIHIHGDGKYTVRYVIETPATDVTLRMQFAVLRPSLTQPEIYEQVGTITLPPTSFRPDANALTEGRPLQWKVQQRGNSRLLKSCDGLGLRLERIATATFGTAPK